MITRRDFLAKSGAIVTSTTILAMSLSTFGQGSNAAGSRRVWLDMNQAQLNDAYDQSVYASNMEDVFKRFLDQSAAARSRLGEPEKFSYGDSPSDNLVVYRASRKDAPIHVFIHGGSWRFGSAEGYVATAEPIVNAGANAVLLNFASVTNDSVPLIVLAQQVRNAVAWIYNNAERFNGNSNQIFVSGHSSGGHLSGVILTTDWARDYRLPADIVKGGLCCSGMFDLEPVRLSSRNEWLHLTNDEVQKLSAQRHIDKLNAPLIVAYGTNETPEFQRQSRDFAAAVEAVGKPVELVVAEGYNHFEIMESFTSPYGIVGHALLAQMGLA